MCVGADLRVCPAMSQPWRPPSPCRGVACNAHVQRYAQYAAFRCRATIVAQGLANVFLKGKASVSWVYLPFGATSISLFMLH